MEWRLVKWAWRKPPTRWQPSTLTCVNYSEALRAVADGARVQRLSWPPGTFLIRVPGSIITVDADRPLGKAAPELVGQQVHYSAHIDMFSAGEMSPWHANRDDITATDWETR